MNARVLLRYTLLLLVCGSLVYLAAREITVSGDGVWDGLGKESLANADGSMPIVVVYYLSVGKDCATCENLEEWTREVLQTQFGEALRDGTITWRAYDMDKDAHAHFVTDFSLYTKSVVLARIENGTHAQWKNLDGIWDRVYDKPAFIAYLRDEIDDFLKAAA